MKIYDTDFTESYKRFALPTTTFTYQALSRKASLDVCRFDGTTYLWDPKLTGRGKKYSEIYQVALVDDQEALQRLDYSFSKVLNTFLSDRKIEGKPTDLNLYKLVVGVERVEEGNFYNNAYTVESWESVEPPMSYEVSNSKLEEELTKIENGYLLNTERYLGVHQTVNPPAVVKTGEDLSSEDLPF